MTIRILCSVLMVVGIVAASLPETAHAASQQPSVSRQGSAKKVARRTQSDPRSNLGRGPARKTGSHSCPAARVASARSTKGSTKGINCFGQTGAISAFR
jgi:hypothetical protein